MEGESGQAFVGLFYWASPARASFSGLTCTVDSAPHKHLPKRLAFTNHPLPTKLNNQLFVYQNAKSHRTKKVLYRRLFLSSFRWWASDKTRVLHLFYMCTPSGVLWGKHNEMEELFLLISRSLYVVFSYATGILPLLLYLLFSQLSSSPATIPRASYPFPKILIGNPV